MTASVTSLNPPSPPPTMGRIVIVREPHMDPAPAIVVRVHKDGTIDVNIFRATHAVHPATRLEQIDSSTTDVNARGWYWPPRAP